jgi:hypothetical protein
MEKSSNRKILIIFERKKISNFFSNFEKNRNGPNGILVGLGETDS